MTIFRNMHQSEAAQIGGCAVSQVQNPAIEADHSARWRHEPGQHIEQLALAVARDPGDADDFTGMNREGCVRQARHALPVDHAQSGDFQHRLPGRSGGLFHLQEHTAADHQFGQCRRRRAGGIKRRYHLAPAHHRDAVGHGHDLAQFVGDQDHCLALRAQGPQQVKQRVGFRRGQHGGRFVQNENIGAPVERLQDFDPLLQADRKIADNGVRFDSEAIVAGEPADFHTSPGKTCAEHHPALGPEHDVFEHGQGFNQHEMLVDHADTMGDSLFRRAQPDRIATDTDFAGISFIEAVEDRHQGRFASAVLADNAVDRACRDIKIDGPVGMNSAEALVDCTQRDGSGRQVHGMLEQNCAGAAISICPAAPHIGHFWSAI